MKQLILASLLILSFAACSDDISFSEQIETDLNLIKAHLATNNLPGILDTTTQSFYYHIDIEGENESESDTVTLGSLIEVRYKGYLLDNTVFDETTGDETIKFSLGQVIEGWQLAIPLLKRGGKGTFYLPSGLAYGSASIGSIPPNSPLVFDIELVGFDRPFEEQLAIDSTIIQMHLESTMNDAVYDTDLELFYDLEDDVLETGTGNSPTTVHIVEVKYKGYFLDGTVFDETPGDTTVEFPLQNVIEGWKRAVPLLQRGGKGTFYIPSGLAYGFIGTTTIPTNSNLVFDIELIDFR